METFLRARVLSFQSAPLLRGATVDEAGVKILIEFQSAPLLRGATSKSRPNALVGFVSIRAPLARGDPAKTGMCHGSCGFNPRPSCEGRPENERRNHLP